MCKSWNDKECHTVVCANGFNASFSCIRVVKKKKKKKNKKKKKKKKKNKKKKEKEEI